MKEHSGKDTLDQIVDEIISELPLKERVPLANMDKEDVEVLQSVFDLYIQSKVNPNDEEYTVIMKALWEKLQGTHKLRVVK
jgi:hypothetical protein